MNMKTRRIVRCLGSALAFTCGLASLSHGATDISQIPLNVATSAPPIMMLAMSRDEQLFKKAYADYTDLDGDGLLDTTYQDDFSYSGYFDSGLCYSYNSTHFKAAAAATDINGNGKAHECGSSAAGRWSGNFLNWMTMSRIDMLRFVLYGGNRSEDTSTKTVLERAHIPNDLHAWVKVYSGTDIANYTPFTGSQSFCNASFAANGEPKFLRAPGAWPEWAASAIKQCIWKEDTSENAGDSDRPNSPGSNDEFTVRAEVCDPSGSHRENFCKKYGTSYKPIGLLQEYGEPTPGTIEGKMRFGLLSGSWSNPRSGGILRRNIGKLANNSNAVTPVACTTGDEIDLRNGSFCNQTNGTEGIINAISRFKLTQWGGSSWSDCNTYGIHNRTGTNQLNNPGSGSASNRKCSAWGNPISEIYAEAVRYLSGEDVTAAFCAGSDLSGLPAASWLDPYRSGAGGNGWCASANILVLSSGLSSFDSDEIPANSVLERDAAAATSGVGEMEEINGKQYFVGRMVANQSTLAVGNAVSTHEDLCTAETVSDLSLVRGLCPDIPSQEGSYLMAGLAWQARSQDMRSDLTGKPADKAVNITTYTVALSENLPKFNIPVGDDGAVTFSPLCQANNTGSATASSSGWRSCYLGSVSVGSKTSNIAYQSSPSRYHVYGRDLEVVGQQAVAGSYSLVWEDSQWGNDHDNDVVTMITFCVGSACNYKYMGDSGSRPGTHNSYTNSYSGYDICWRSDSSVCKDASTSGKPVVARDEVLIRIENLSAYAGNAMLTGYSITGSNDDGVKRAALRPGSTDGSVLTATANPRSEWARPQVLKFRLGSSDVKLLENPLWYAAKYGGFVTQDKTKELTPQAQGETSWDKTGDGVPDTYFNVRDPARLKESLGKVFSDVLARGASASAVSTNSTQAGSDTLIYQARFNSADWSGQVVAFAIDPTTGVVSGSPSWDTDSAGKIPAAAHRKIFTWDPEAESGAGDGIDFLWNNLSATQQTALGSASLGPARLQWLRGDQSNELGSGLGLFRQRSKVLGDIVNSNPRYAGNKEDLRYGTLPSTEGSSYKAYVETKATRPSVLYVGANDGMLHAFNAQTGAELFAYVPNEVIPRLPALTDPAYLHQYFVDGSPFVGDAYLNGWKRVLVGSTGAGGRSVFALDVSNPSAAAMSAANVMWEFSTAEEDADKLGIAMSVPIIARLEADKRWVAIFGNGYNSDDNVKLMIVDLATGVLLKAIDTGVTGLNNGLASPAVVDVDGDQVTDYVYAGDLQGNLWKFDLTGSGVSDWSVAFEDADGLPLPLFQAVHNGVGQPITVQPTVGFNRAPGIDDTGLMIYFITGKYFETGDANVGNNPPIQTVYGLWDNGDRVPSCTGNGAGGAARCGGLTRQTIVAELESSQRNWRVLSNNTVAYSNSNKGWYLDLAVNGSGAGERGVSNLLLRLDLRATNDRLIFSTMTPSPQLCDDGGSSWLMEISALTGGRLESEVFDVNGDGQINSADFVTLPDGTRVQPSGAHHSVIVSRPAFVELASGRAMKYLSGSDGSIQTELNVSGFDLGRQSWLQLR